MKKTEYRKLVSTCMTFAFAGVGLTGLIAVFGRTFRVNPILH
ncbi:hypothetical protein Dalk_0510 [Desulfatibacillum aliphaticivorans]|uniref:Uncharacterized protein n=1 Tax=Desulfatibacillum aliphaticivorans TaxID=218208 RepID=B8FHC9_DESAL|nr:hypothetical protein [Desulfatibacillum aliphaticivorans]ACL02217.1 hypothetical protein Dalk_0510 [Desulfatibacillum aliphaticivorans]